MNPGVGPVEILQHFSRPSRKELSSVLGPNVTQEQLRVEALNLFSHFSGGFSNHGFEVALPYRLQAQLRPHIKKRKRFLHTSKIC